MNNRYPRRQRKERKCEFCVQKQDPVKVISAGELQKVYLLIERIYTEAIASEIRRLCEENCFGCKIAHPSQRQHDCLMLTIEERWDLYCKDAVAFVNEKRSIWDEFLEAARVLKLTYNEDILERLIQLEKASEITLNALWEYYSNNENPEMNCILQYLAYWRETKK